MTYGITHHCRHTGPILWVGVHSVKVILVVKFHGHWQCFSILGLKSFVARLGQQASAVPRFRLQMKAKRGRLIINHVWCDPGEFQLPSVLSLNTSLYFKTSYLIQTKHKIDSFSFRKSGGRDVRRRIIQMVICNNPCCSAPLILVVVGTVLFANYQQWPK